MENYKYWLRCGKTGTLVKWCSHFKSQFNNSSKIIQLPYDLAIPHQVYIQKNWKQTRTDTCMPMFTATLFKIAIKWKQPQCPKMDEWINKFWHIHTMDYLLFSHKKKWSSDTHYNVDEPQKHAKWKQPGTKSPVLYDSIYMK